MRHMTPAAVTQERCGPPVEARDAASLIVVRGLAGSPDAAQILMGRREAGHRFMPGVRVFPGGAVDAQDFTAIAASPLKPGQAALLEQGTAPGLGHALAMAAARELQEEVGLCLGVPPALDGLIYLCRAITPAASPIRFDARFFVAAATSVSGCPMASREIEDPRWYTVSAALQCELAGATRAVLEVFASWLQSDRTRWKVPVLRERKWSRE